MIKFFRKIRQKLLSKGNTGKYLKYAIGEIILVVIGILIALQINNWNEGVKENLRRENYYKQLILDLENDKAYARQILSNLDSANKRYTAYKKSLETPNLGQMEIFQKLGENEFKVSDLEYKTSTIESLLSTGELQILSPTLRDLLTKYNNSKTQTETLSRYNNQHALDLLKAAILSGGTIYSMQEIFNQPELLESLDFEKRFPDIFIAFNGFLFYKLGIYEIAAKRLTDEIEEANSIIEIINTELGN